MSETINEIIKDWFNNYRTPGADLTIRSTNKHLIETYYNNVNKGINVWTYKCIPNMRTILDIEPITGKKTKSYELNIALDRWY